MKYARSFDLNMRMELVLHSGIDVVNLSLCMRRSRMSVGIKNGVSKIFRPDAVKIIDHTTNRV
jgi:hypothetical protein